jgi:MYXO-CTERM domain-containing protein
MLAQDVDAGIAQATPALLVSEDGGATWGAPRVISGGTFNDQPFIAAVHPDDPDTLFVRTYAWSPSEDGGPDVADDALFVTSDAGLTFREVLRKHAKLHGFALSPDGSTVLVGYGDPQQAARDVWAEDVGIYRANTADLVAATVVAEPFTQALNAAVSCLTWNEHGLYACFDTMVGVSADGSIPSMSSGFTPILHNADVRGPLACNSTTCLPEWQDGREDIPAVCERIAAECDVDTATHVLACGGGMGGTGGTGGSPMGGSGASGGAVTGGTPSAGSGPLSGAGGTAASGAPSGGRAGSTTNAGQAGEPPSDDDSGGSCGCRAPRPSGHAGAFAALALITLLGLRKRRHTRARSTRRTRSLSG